MAEIQGVEFWPFCYLSVHTSQ